MDDTQLQAWIEAISLHSFGVPFRHKASFNRRLRTTGGRYFLKSHNIEINPAQLHTYGKEEVEKIIKHELCHYHLHLSGRGYRHRDPEFKALLQKVDGSRYCQSLPGSANRRSLPYRYKLICARCGMEYMRKRKVDPARYRCGKCSGALKLHTI
ncbi:SprT family protein [Paenibacillus sp. D2_2]|uniref:SprT family protein n=1 Tax=Paenibacillus sp. D2_2 TaxID=3073092 RepID=UPI0028166954|nr:SprT family protein [Paenibacillus sp. D2_2]WMT39961.1 SprT family protein [Paenibacillus sp. D2_2]